MAVEEINLPRALRVPVLKTGLLGNAVRTASIKEAVRDCGFTRSPIPLVRYDAGRRPSSSRTSTRPSRTRPAVSARGSARTKSRTC